MATFIVLRLMATILLKGLSLGHLYAYLLIPYRSQPAKRATLNRSSIGSIRECLGLSDDCLQNYLKPVLSCLPSLPF